MPGTFSILRKNFRIIRVFSSSDTGLCLRNSSGIKMTIFLEFIHWRRVWADQNEFMGAYKGHSSVTHHSLFRSYLVGRVLKTDYKCWSRNPFPLFLILFLFMVQLSVVMLLGLSPSQQDLCLPETVVGFHAMETFCWVRNMTFSPGWCCSVG